MNYKGCLNIIFLVAFACSGLYSAQLTDMRSNKKLSYDFALGYLAPIPFITQYGNATAPIPSFFSIPFAVDPDLLIKPILLTHKSIASFVKGKPKIYAQVVFHVPKVGVNFNQPLNMRFHPFASIFEYNKQDFNTPFPIVILGDQGLNRAVSRTRSFLTFDVFTNHEVHVHPTSLGIAFSPDNTKIMLDNTYSLATFVSLAYKDDYVTVTYHIVLKNVAHSLASTILSHIPWIAVGPLTYPHIPDIARFFDNLDPAKLSITNSHDKSLWNDTYTFLKSILVDVQVNTATHLLKDLIEKLKQIETLIV